MPKALPPMSGDACNYLQSLKMHLHGMIHNFYIKALKLLPTLSGSFMRSILKAGHCYGSCDPLSNIILNSIWYDTCGSSLPLSDRTKFAEYNDVLDPLTLVRPVVRSVEGLVKLALLANPQSSVACAMEKLCSAKCAVVDMLSSARERNHLHEAAMAAGHPLPLELGELHRLLLLMPDERSSLLSFITEAQTSGGVLNVDCMRSPYEGFRSWLRSEIEQVLQDYMERHFWGPNYKLDIILGVEESSEGHYPFIHTTRYHINFLATSDPKLQRTLFFAELWDSREPKPEFCCPLPYEYAGRCHYGVHAARKIVYPDDAKYIPDDITHGGTGSVDGMLEMDLVYFSSESDVELAQKLNMLPSYARGNVADMY
ncbi:hypothetical protein VPH35_040804 [Triticum aestivum]